MIPLIIFSLPTIGRFSAPFLPVYSFFIALWAVCMLEFWKRKEKSTALQWGTINFEIQELDRPGKCFDAKLVSTIQCEGSVLILL
jgi:hypothetical protein